MGQCVCKERKNQRRLEVDGSQDDHYRTTEDTSLASQRQVQVLRTLGSDIRDLIMETLAVIRTLVNK